jgi:hypothetical protein
VFIATLFIFRNALAHFTGRQHVHTDNECHQPAPVCFWGSSKISRLQNLSLENRNQPHDNFDVAEFMHEVSLDVEALVVVLVDDESYSTSSVASAAFEGSIPNIVSADAMLPYVYPSERKLSHLMTDKCNESQVALTRTTSVDLIDTMNSKSILLNDMLDVVLTEAVKASEADGVISSLLEFFEIDPSKKFVIVLASNAAMEGCGRRRLIAEHIRSRRLQEITTIRSIKMTPCILAGLLFLFLFIFLLWIGLSCLGAISYPKEFIHPEQQPALGREF